MKLCSSSSNWFSWLIFLLLLALQQSAECRYLPTRSHRDDLDKLRELMLQILESSNEDSPIQQQQLLRPPNEANKHHLPFHSSWINKPGLFESLDGPLRGSALYERGRYY